MAIRPEDLTKDQESYLVTYYDAQPNASLDATIKQNLREFKQARSARQARETDYELEHSNFKAAEQVFKNNIKKIERQIKVKNSVMISSLDALIDRHFELGGEIPPLDQPVYSNPNPVV